MATFAYPLHILLVLDGLPTQAHLRTKRDHLDLIMILIPLLHHPQIVLCNHGAAQLDLLDLHSHHPKFQCQEDLHSVKHGLLCRIPLRRSLTPCIVLAFLLQPIHLLGPHMIVTFSHPLCLRLIRHAVECHSRQSSPRRIPISNIIFSRLKTICVPLVLALRPMKETAVRQL